MFAITRGQLAVAALGLSAAVATAQGPPTFLHGPVVGCPLGNCAAANHGTYGPALFAANPVSKHFALPGPNEPSCVGRSSYPLSDWHYIRQFCGPTLQPGTCHGYHQTKWRKWEETCANAGVGGCATAPDLVPPPLMTPPPQQIAPITPPPEPLPLPKGEVPKDLPKGDVPKVDPVTPPKVSPIPKEGKEPAPLPNEPGKITTTDAPMPMPTTRPGVVLPQPEPRVVVPPIPK